MCLLSVWRNTKLPALSFKFSFVESFHTGPIVNTLGVLISEGSGLTAIYNWRAIFFYTLAGIENNTYFCKVV